MEVASWNLPLGVCLNLATHFISTKATVISIYSTSTKLDEAGGRAPDRNATMAPAAVLNPSLVARRVSGRPSNTALSLSPTFQFVRRFAL